MNKVFVVECYDRLCDSIDTHGIFSTFEKAKEHAVKYMQKNINEMDMKWYTPLMETIYYINEVILDSDVNNERIILVLSEEERKIKYKWYDNGYK